MLNVMLGLLSGSSIAEPKSIVGYKHIYRVKTIIGSLSLYQGETSLFLYQDMRLDFSKKKIVGVLEICFCFC